MKRSRYTVTDTEGRKHVVLAYNGQGAVDYYNSRGICAVKVEKGDYRLTAEVGGGHRIDQSALAEAKELLGIKWPVKITTNGRQGRMRGCHRVEYRGTTIRGNRMYGLDDAVVGGQYHNITVKSYLSPEQAGKTLWHELTHAMQAEREAAAANAVTPRQIHTAWSACNARGRGIGYQHKPIEVEAREHEAFNDDLPLAR